MSRFYDTSLPDIQPTTRIIGLCGAHDGLNPDGVRDSDPTLSGWMLSNFYLMNTLFSGLGRSQAWFTCVDPDNLIRQYGELAHGYCYRGRRVVLDANQHPDRSTLHIETAETLLPKFLEYLKLECENACKAGHSVLLCVFCHGEESTYNLYIGDLDDSDALLKIGDIIPILDANRNLQLCMLMTSCYSGGWAITLDLAATHGRRLTTMTTAGHDKESEAWPLTNSLGRACGSMYISAILNVLEQASDEIDEKNAQNAQIQSTRDFARAISHQLLNVVDPRLGHVHDIRFAVQADQWSQVWKQRTGIPLQHYRDCLSRLRRMPARPVTDIFLDRGATQAEVDAWETAQPDATMSAIAMGNFGGSLLAVRRSVCSEARVYMRSNPGRDSLSNNIAEHGLIQKCAETPGLLTEASWPFVWEILRHRNSQMALAETILRKLGLKAPRAHEFNEDAWLTKNINIKASITLVSDMIIKAGIFAQRDYKIVGRHYTKPRRYLTAGLIDSELGEEKVREVLEAVEASKSRILFD